MTSDGTLRVGLAQWGAIPGAPAENLRAAAELIERAARAGCRLVVLPELWACGYAPATLAADSAAAAEPLTGPRGQALAALAQHHDLWLAAGSVPEADAGRIYNTAALYDPDGRLAARHRKFCLYAPGGEPDVFAAGDGPTVCDCAELGRTGLIVCFDGDFPETGRALRAAGARLVIEPAAYEFAAESWWDRLYPAHALANGQWWILVNQAGGDARRGASGAAGCSRPPERWWPRRRGRPRARRLTPRFSSSAFPWAPSSTRACCSPIGPSIRSRPWPEGRRRLAELIAARAPAGCR